jgi:hypothetical protein
VGESVRYICCGKDCGLDMTTAVMEALAEVDWGAKAIFVPKTDQPTSVVVTCPNGHACRYSARS